LFFERFTDVLSQANSRHGNNWGQRIKRDVDLWLAVDRRTLNETWRRPRTIDFKIRPIRRSG
jgi:hypothetical protein